MTENPKPTVVEAWSSVMADLREIRKDEESAGGGPRFSFRGIDTVMNAAGPILRQHRVIVLPHKIIEAKHRDFADKNGKTVHEAIVTVGYRIYGPAGDHIDGESIGESADYSDKATTQSMSVAYRTFLLQALTMPTDSDDPDHGYVERQDGAEDAKAQALGWTTASERDAVWNNGVAAMGKLDDPSPVVAWGTKIGLGIETFSPAQAEEWARRIGEAAAPNVAPEPEAQPEPTAALAAAPDDGFDPKAAWAAMADLYGRLDDARKPEVGAWMGEQGLTPVTVTAESSAAFYAFVEGLMAADGEQAPAATGKRTLKDRGWRSKVDLERTLASLRERANGPGHPLDPGDGSDALDAWTREDALAWGEDLDAAEQS